MRLLLLFISALSLMLAAPAGATLYADRGVAAVLAGTKELEPCPQKLPSGSAMSAMSCYQVRGASVSGFVDPEMVDDGFLGNGQEVLIVPLTSGGSGGVFDVLLYTRRGTEPFAFVGYLPSDGHLSVYLNVGFIVEKTPVYKASDPQCCPSGFHYKQETLDGIKLRQIMTWSEP
jgi:hypothetical protein